MTEETPESNLTRLLDRITNRVDAYRQDTMTGVDVINRLNMNGRLQHNFRRMDAQVDAHMKKQHGDCYTPPSEDESDMAEGHRVNSPITFTVIGDSAAKALSEQLNAVYPPDGTSTDGTTASAASDANANASPSSSPNVKKNGWVIPAAIAGASLLGGGLGAAGSLLLNDPPEIPDFIDTDSQYDISAIPFNPDQDWNQP